MVLYEVGSVRSKRGITGEEAGGFIGFNKIHICVASPAIYAIPITLVHRRGCVNSDVAHLGCVAWCQWNRMAVTLFAEPFGDGRRSEQRNVVRERVQRIEGQMIRVSVRHQDRIQLGQRFERYPWSTDAWKDFPESRIKVRIRKDPFPADLN